ncbi:MAG: hypothetical protein GEV28_15950 [Actinophytocola sp.]|uniref:hypothetical protein n=1 Tax=Actinophytocola sp. TaxID=1872138 RepID=UPI001324B3A4|nr:hypothetical protein [Actinophytocola sp.]MPZ81803.1 hypothetical protein [Actinophytocola sp.]
MLFMNGRQIYDNFQEGVGPEGMVGGAAIVNEVASDYEARSRQVRELVGRMESAWEGEAAGAAQRGAGPMASEHELSGPSLATAQDLTNRQAGSYTDAKNAVMPVPPKPEMSNPMVVFTVPGGVARFEDQVDEYNAAAQHNVDVMNRYEGASGYNIRELPSSYGTLTDDKSGISVGPDTTTIDSEDFADTAGGDGSGDSGGGGGSPAPGPGSGDTGGAVSGGGAPSPGGDGLSTVTPDAGATTPGSFTPSTTTPVAPVVAGTDSGMGARRPPGGLVPGVGVLGGPGLGGSPGADSGGGRAGGGGAGPRGGAGLRGGVLGGPGVGAEPHGPAGRPGPSSGGVTGAPGRGGPGMGGVPMGAAGRGRDGEDTERTRPAYLEGGDPDELFDTDEKTAPPAIGADDD